MDVYIQCSRARLLEAAIALLRAGGPSAVTVDAVTRGANVAPATLHRHFPTGNDLLTAAFNGLPESPRPRTADTSAITTLCERIAQQYTAPFDAVFDSPDAAVLGDIDRGQAIALLTGPVVLGRLCTLPDFDYRECARAAVDGSLHVQRVTNDTLSELRNVSAGA